MKCPACTSDENRVMSTRDTDGRVARLRCCQACGHRWPTVELPSASLLQMERAAEAVRSITSLSRELDATPAHG